MKDFDKKLKAILKKKNITQSQLAKGVNLSKGAISQYVNGYSQPTYNNLLIICHFLNVPISYFVDKTGEELNEFLSEKVTVDDNLKQVILNKMISGTKKLFFLWKRSEDNFNEFVTTFGDLKFSIRKDTIDNEDYYYIKIDDDIEEYKFDDSRELTLSIKDLYDEISKPENPIRKLEKLNFNIDKVIESSDHLKSSLLKKSKGN